MFWFHLNSGNCASAFNMALDEALLEHAARLGRPILRFYGWTEPAATFGYFQRYADVAAATKLRPLIRRPTGGGIVPHDIDWTYSFTVPPGHGWYDLKAEESYRRIHEWIRDAFAELKIETDLAPCCHKLKLPDGQLPGGACFIGHEKSDLLWHGKKIAGAAQRRNKFGLLIQGSVQPPPVPVTRAAFETAMHTAAAKNFKVLWREYVPDTELQHQTNRLQTEKYSQEMYNQKR